VARAELVYDGAQMRAVVTEAAQRFGRKGGQQQIPDGSVVVLAIVDHPICPPCSLTTRCVESMETNSHPHLFVRSDANGPWCCAVLPAPLASA
jgi:hypothetical protein